jgi:hypothetical protein
MGFTGKPVDTDILSNVLKSLAKSGKAKVSLIGNPSNVVDAQRSQMVELELQVIVEQQQQ